MSIAQFGSTRSINAGVAAGIAMHAWIRQHADLHGLAGAEPPRVGNGPLQAAVQSAVSRRSAAQPCKRDGVYQVKQPAGGFRPAGHATAKESSR